MSAWRIGADATAGGLRMRGGQAKDGGVQEFFDRLTKWIPGDTLALYAPGVTALLAVYKKPCWQWLVGMALATPIFVIMAGLANGGVTKRVVWSAILAFGAFLIWSLSVPQSGWQLFPTIAKNQVAVSLGAAVGGIIFGFFAEYVLTRVAP